MGSYLVGVALIVLWVRFDKYLRVKFLTACAAISVDGGTSFSGESFLDVRTLALVGYSTR